MIPKLFFLSLFSHMQRILSCKVIISRIEVPYCITILSYGLFTSLCNLLIFHCSLLKAQPNGGAAITAMGNTTAISTGIWSVNANPAGIVTLSRPSVCLSYSTVMNLPELACQDVLFAFPAKRNRFGIGVERYGFSDFNQLTAGVVYGKKFGDQLSLATRFNFQQVNEAEYGAVSAFTFDMGFRYVFNNNVALGACISNPIRQQYATKERNFRIFSGFSGGLSWQSSEQVLLAADLEKEAGQPADFRTGIAYGPSPVLIFRGGLSLKPLRHYAGFQVARKLAVMEFAVSSDPQFGYRPQIAMGYAW